MNPLVSICCIYLAGFLAHTALAQPAPELNLRVDPTTGKANISYYGTLGGEYRLKHSPNLIDWNDFTPLAPITPGRNRIVEIIGETADPRSFYRLEFTPPPCC